MPRTVALIDYGSGNLRSAEKALTRAAEEHAMGFRIIVTADADEIRAAERVVLPGVGAFGDCMAGLGAIGGMIAALNETVIGRGVPFLGVCVGMQLMATMGHEFGDHTGLGWITGEVVHLQPSDPLLKIPHMGWNELHVLQAHPLFAEIDDGAHFYFVHSYELRPRDPGEILATTDHGGAVTAAVARGNVAGVQFHPEKSQHVGLKLLQNFLKWQP